MDAINKQQLFLLEEIVKKNFSAKYKESVLGILWSVIKPLLIMVIMTIIFSTLFHNRIENYPIYLLSGKCIFDFFNAGTNISLMAIKGNKNILTKTSAPKYIFVLGAVISEFLNFIISIIILVAVMIATKSPFYFPSMLLSIIPIISLLMMIMGLGFILSILCVYYTDIKHLWGVITMVAMYASAIFYPMDIIPEPYHQFMILNPIYWIIEQFRDFVIYGALPDALFLVNTIYLSAIILIFGILIFRKFEKKTAMKF